MRRILALTLLVLLAAPSGGAAAPTPRTPQTQPDRMNTL